MQLYKEVFKRILSAAFAMFREDAQQTIEEMAGNLKISSRSYGDLEHGKFAASSVVFLRFLLEIGFDNREKLLSVFAKCFKELDESSATAK